MPKDINDTMKMARVLGITGAVIVWLPVLAPFFFSAVAFLGMRQFRFDFLMPAELFPLVIIGSTLLILSAHVSKHSKEPIGLRLGIAVALLVLSQGIAVVTGLADGRTDPSGWQGSVVLGMIGLFDLAVVSIGWEGTKLLKKEFAK